MYLGKIVEINDADLLYQNPVHPYTRALLASIPVPDPEKVKKHEALAGEVPSPINPPSGCYFHTRCPYVQDICRSEVPVLKPVSPSHKQDWLASCHFASDFLGKPV
jgi:oligopeptide/dipeptide ABC transporter ATP-binding protein